MVQRVPQTSISGDSSFRNLFINGDMRVAQRGATATTVVYDKVHTVDQWKANYTQGATSVFSVEQSTDVPTGEGFENSLLYKCTTAESSLNAAQRMMPLCRVEGQNCQNLDWGTSSAKSLTLSFWVKSNLTGTYQINLWANDASSFISDTYAISSANTWEFKTCHFAGNQGSAITADDGPGVQAEFVLSAGSDYTGGTQVANTTTTYPSYSATTRAASHGVNMASSTSNNWYLTGVQLEAGGTGTNFTDPSDFEFLPFDVQSERCRRYFQNVAKTASSYICNAWYYTDTKMIGIGHLDPEMRATPSLDAANVTDGYVFYAGGAGDNLSDLGLGSSSSQVFVVDNDNNVADDNSVGRAGGLYRGNNVYVYFDAEL